MKTEIKAEDVEWTMVWGKDKPDTQEFEEEMALALLLANGVVFLNSLWWEKECPERIQNAIAVAVNCNDIFAWACADAEQLPYDQIETLYRMWKADERWGPAKWCCLKRKEKPQKPVIDAMKKDGAWDEQMEALGKNVTDAQVHQAMGVQVPDYAK